MFCLFCCFQIGIIAILLDVVVKAELEELFLVKKSYPTSVDTNTHIKENK